MRDLGTREDVKHTLIKFGVKIPIVIPKKSSLISELYFCADLTY